MAKSTTQAHVARLAQQVAELLAIALAGYKSKDLTKDDQEAFVVIIHGTQLHLVTATFRDRTSADRDSLNLRTQKIERRP